MQRESTLKWNCLNSVQLSERKSSFVFPREKAQIGHNGHRQMRGVYQLLEMIVSLVYVNLCTFCQTQPRFQTSDMVYLGVCSRSWDVGDFRCVTCSTLIYEDVRCYIPLRWLSFNERWWSSAQIMCLQAFPEKQKLAYSLFQS